ncbi:flavin-binding monooxygenase protein [Rutstroemia sp. NJR-2017a WRK4]|nr:flavin-binding monooxygenase protein [Rutstroemia sp. NJR-2017a WRK4]
MSVQTKNPKFSYDNTIRRNYEGQKYTYYPVAIIGAGESGIAMGCRLKEVLGFNQFRIFDRQSGVGGTWWINRYPGVGCDIPSIFYSFSFCPNYEWSCFHPGGAEVVRYLESVCEKYGIVDKIQINTDVREARWLASEQVWEVKLQHLIGDAGDLSESDRARKVKEQGYSSVYTHEEIIRCKVLISAVGGLVEPKVWPDSIPGKDIFQGEIFHSARWRYDIDLKDKNVIVVGTGCSAAQFVPKLTTDYGAKSVTQLMLSPPWVSSRPLPPGGEKFWEKWSSTLNKNIPGFNKFIRLAVAATCEYDFRLFGSGAYNQKEREKLEAETLAEMRRSAPEKYHEILTPNYGIGTKRRIFDATWYASLHDPKVELTTLPLRKLHEKSVTLGPGRMYPPENVKSSAPTHEITIPADVIVLANGFETTKWLHPLNIYGTEGQKLHDVFEQRGGPQMYMGTAMDGFPNFFTVIGPNCFTGHTSVIFTTENMVTHTLKMIKPILNGDVRKIEVKKEAEINWTRELQTKLRNMVWSTGGAKNWYVGGNGWNSNTYPYSQLYYLYRCTFPTWKDWNLSYTRKGTLKKWTQNTVLVLAFGLALLDQYKRRSTGVGLGAGEVIAGWVRRALRGVAALSVKVQERI